MISNHEKLIPNKGVYAALVCYNERDYNAMLYIGSRPTLGDHLEQTIEVHIMNFDTGLDGEGSLKLK
ncbi:MAG: riboflavin kinase [Saprospiraceae bacterium]